MKKISRFEFAIMQVVDPVEAKKYKPFTEKEELEKTLYHNPPSGFSKVQELSGQLAALNEEIDQATERWMELAERES